MAAVGITSFASQDVLWIPLLGMFTGLLTPKAGLVIMAVAWGILMVFNLVTLPAEFDASRRAKLVLAKMGFIQRGPESAAVSQVLNAAAWTYVAAFISLHLAIAGPDIHATARDHTIEAAWLKVIKNVKRQIERRKTKQDARHKDMRLVAARAASGQDGVGPQR